MSPGLQLDSSTFNAIAGLRYSSADLPDSFDATHRNASSYGLWGKWFSPGDGFHRGIDISFGENNIIYSICDGEVVHRQPSTGWSYLIVRVTSPERFSNQYITYMHAGFESLSPGDIVTLGQKIGVEKKYGAAGCHTHIELNSSFDPNTPNSFPRAKHPSESIGSLGPYPFISECFSKFYDSIVEANT